MLDLRVLVLGGLLVLISTIYLNYVAIILKRTPIFEYWMARLVAKNGHLHDTCYNEIVLWTLSIYTILGSVVDTLGRSMC